eukprot:6225158-Prymnesium_polylepis.1
MDVVAQHATRRELSGGRVSEVDERRPVLMREVPQVAASRAPVRHAAKEQECWRRLQCQCSSQQPLQCPSLLAPTWLHPAKVVSSMMSSCTSLGT